MAFFDWFKSKSASNASPVDNAGVWRTIHEPYTGAWQKNDEIEISRADQLRHHAVFACISLISRDVGKLKIEVKRAKKGVKQAFNSKMLPLLKNPNPHQTTQQFFEDWAKSKASTGNAYVLKVRNIYGELWRLYVLNPERVKPLVDPNGNVFYQVKKDRLFNIEDDIIIPASEVIHDRFNCFYHPLVGLSPVTACSLSASQGVNIQRNASQFFSNASRPSGIIVSPSPISEEDAKTIGQRWRENYSGVNAGNTAVFGDGVEYKPIAVSANDAQLVEQLRLSGEVICTAFSVPAFKIGMGSLPATSRISDLNEIYYSDCLQHYIESIENLLTQHLDLEDGAEVEFNLKALLRMDATSTVAYLREGISAAIFSPNEARAELGLGPVEGGDSPMIQQQNYSLAALAKRDAQADPFNPDKPAEVQPEIEPEDDEGSAENVDE